MTEEKKPSTTVLNVEKHPCGCKVTEYSDKRKEIAPCVPCGLFSTAQALRTASEALAAVATTIKDAAKQKQEPTVAVARTMPPGPHLS
jgi:hypothetical protein